jgi:hypothetical protein
MTGGIADEKNIGVDIVPLGDVNRRVLSGDKLL